MNKDRAVTPPKPLEPALEPPQETEQCPRCYSAVRYVRLWISGFTGNCTNPWHDSPEPKLAPQAEQRYSPYLIPDGDGYIAEMCWDPNGQYVKLSAQAPLLQKIAELEGQAERLNQHMDAGVECERRDCSKALLAMAAVGICTPEEGYGTNSSWAISDLCRAVEKPREVGK